MTTTASTRYLDKGQNASASIVTVGAFIVAQGSQKDPPAVDAGPYVETGRSSVTV